MDRSVHTDWCKYFAFICMFAFTFVCNSIAGNNNLQISHPNFKHKLYIFFFNVIITLEYYSLCNSFCCIYNFCLLCCILEILIYFHSLLLPYCCRKFPVVQLIKKCWPKITLLAHFGEKKEQFSTFHYYRTWHCITLTTFWPKMTLFLDSPNVEGFEIELQTSQPANDGETPLVTRCILH